jgi:hypothetical protein
MKGLSKILIGIILAVIVLSTVILPAFAGAKDWWDAFVDVKVTAQLNSYKDTYWGFILSPGYLDCQSASLTVGNVVYNGTIKPWWWLFKSCDATFYDVPADTTAILTLNYKANGNRTFQKAIYIGKTWWGLIRLPKMILPWSNY